MIYVKQTNSISKSYIIYTYYQSSSQSYCVTHIKNSYKNNYVLYMWSIYNTTWLKIKEIHLGNSDVPDIKLLGLCDIDSMYKNKYTRRT